MILLKKALRSILSNKRAYLSCIALIGVGISVLISFQQLYINLNGALGSFYRSSSFGDVFAEVKGLPLSEVGRLSAIPGIERTEARITGEARVLMDDSRIITLILISYDPGAASSLNSFALTHGSAGGEGLLVGQAFLDAHNLQAGDHILFVTSGREYNLTVDAGVLSPEYIYAVQETAAFIPDPAAYGFAYLPYPQLAAMTGKQGTADRLSFLLSDGCAFGDVKTPLEDALDPYGIISLVERKDQSSHAIIHNEIEQLQNMAAALPVIFILMAMVVLYIMLKRVIEQERTQIGTLKALGYSNSQVLCHYLLYGGVTGLCGGLLGILLGVLLTNGMTDLYLEYFHLPDFTKNMSLSLVWAGLLIAVLSGVTGSYFGAAGILRLLPGDAMRPAAPPILRRDIMKNIPFVGILLDSGGAMAVRNISRSRFRSLFVVLGITFSFALITYMSSYGNMMDMIVRKQFIYSQVYDVRITLDRPAAYNDALTAGRALSGIDNVEGLLEQPVILKHGHLEEGATITAMEQGSTLYRIYDNEFNTYYVPPTEGIIINSTLAMKLQTKRGDILHMETPYFEEDIAVLVANVVNENTGMNCYMELGALCRLLELPRSVSDLIVATDQVDMVREAVLESGNVKSVTDKQNSLQVFNDMMGSYDIIMNMLEWAGIAIAAAIVYNTSTIALSERKREYATLRVLGMHPGEIGRIAGFEYWLLALLGMLLGIPMTRLINDAVAAMMDVEMFALPKTIPLYCYLTGAAGCALAVFISNRAAVRAVGRMDMVEVLKERE